MNDEYMSVIDEAALRLFAMSIRERLQDAGIPYSQLNWPTRILVSESFKDTEAMTMLVLQEPDAAMVIVWTPDE